MVMVSDEWLKSIDDSLVCCKDWCMRCGRQTQYCDLHLELGSLVCRKCMPKKN